MGNPQPGALGSKNFTAEARELVIPVLTETSAFPWSQRIYVPPSSNWMLVKVTTEVVLAYGASNSTVIGLRTAGAVDLFTPFTRASIALGTRATLALLGTDEQRTIKGEVGGYHEVYITTPDAGNPGKEQMFLYYRRVQPSGPVGQVRLS